MAHRRRARATWVWLVRLGIARARVEGPAAASLEGRDDAAAGGAEAEEGGAHGQEPFEVGVDGG